MSFFFFETELVEFLRIPETTHETAGEAGSSKVQIYEVLSTAATGVVTEAVSQSLSVSIDS